MSHFSQRFKFNITTLWRATLLGMCAALLLTAIPASAAPPTPTFAATPISFPVTDSPTDVAIADLDGDGKPELVESSDTGDSITVLHNTSTVGVINTASFATPALSFTTGSGSDPQNLAIGDLDGNGKLDIVTANHGSGTVSAFLNTSTTGSISFAARADFLADTSPAGVAIGDLDGDGKPDLVVTNESSNTVIVLRNTSVGAGSIAFAAKATIASFAADGAAAANPEGVALGDMDGDGKLDIVTANYGGQGPSTVNSIFRNTTSTIGNITFAAPVTVSAPSGPFRVKIADLDLDGKLDFVSSKPFSGGRFYIYRNTSSGIGNIAFAPYVMLDIGGGTLWFVLSDLNNDGRSDLVIQRTIAVQVYVNNTTAPGIDTTSFTYANFNASQVNGLSGIAVGDLDGNGTLDIAAGTGGSILVYQNTTPSPEIDLKGNSVSIANGDITPSPTDHTDFDNVNVNSGAVVRTFTIQNTGNAALSVSTPTLSGANAGDFAISSAPAGSVAATGSTTFQVTFDPSATGLRTATVSIGNNDSNENPYTFAIQGMGTAPEIDVFGNGAAIASGDTIPSPADHSDFGTGNVSSGTVVRTFTIQNTGNAALSVSAPTLSGANAGDFAISSAPASSVAAAGSTTFQVTFDPSAAGVRTATVSIGNNDSDENPYTFTIQGVGIAAPSLTIPNTSLDASNGSFSVPVNFTSNSTSIASVGFSLDYQESCLTFDATDGNSDGIPDAITGLPSGFVASISHDANDTGSELDISLFDSTAPMSTLSDGALLTVAFSVKPACITTDGTTTDVTLNFAGDPAPSFSDALATDVTGTSSGATIALQFNATPTAINLGNNSVAENAASGATVGTLSTVDPDSGDSHTYALVSGSGDTDNASFVLDGATLKTAASFDFETKSSYSVRIRTTDDGGLNGTFEQALTINVTNVNEAPVAVADPQDPVTTIFVGGQATTINVLVNDTDPENDPLSVGSVNTSGTQGSVTNNGADVSYTAPNANGSSSFSYQASDGSLSSTDATVNVTYVKNDLRGDCNANGSLTAADFVATILEIFDTNDTLHNSNPAWWLIYTGDFAGSPRGCDSNAGKNGSNNSSDSVSAGDIVCTVLLFFKGNCGASVVAAGQQATAQLTVAAASAQPGQTATVTVNFNPAGNQVAAASFALVIDPSQLGFDATDADSDGLPDAVQLTVPAGMSKSVQWNAAQNRLEVALFGASLPLPTLSEGVLATVNLQVAATAAPGTTTLGVALASLGDTEGQDVTVVPTSGTLTIGDGGAARNLLYLPVAVR